MLSQNLNEGHLKILLYNSFLTHFKNYYKKYYLFLRLVKILATHQKPNCLGSAACNNCQGTTVTIYLFKGVSPNVASGFRSLDFFP
jgi:hypothetical protein